VLGTACVADHGRLAGGSFTEFPASKIPGILVGYPSMSSIGQHILDAASRVSESVSVRLGTRASAPTWDAEIEEWMLQIGSESVRASALAVTTSARSCVRLLGEQSLAGQLAADVRSNVCWALLVAFAEPVSGVPWDAALLESKPGINPTFAWISRNSSKPGRPQLDCWVLHASPEWSNPRADWSRDKVVEDLLLEFQGLLGREELKVVYSEAFRWNNAFPLNSPELPDRCVADTQRCLVAGGDWAVGNRVGDAYESGIAVAAAIEAMLELR